MSLVFMFPKSTPVPFNKVGERGTDSFHSKLHCFSVVTIL